MKWAWYFFLNGVGTEDQKRMLIKAGRGRLGKFPTKYQYLTSIPIGTFSYRAPVNDDRIFSEEAANVLAV
ncbi:hypothetical protein PS639_04325 [Pseudomonas fluorescens]|nr:hypothetical protein PS639_04325 [Pseudomonas fluorescens]